MCCERERESVVWATNSALYEYVLSKPAFGLKEQDGKGMKWNDNDCFILMFVKGWKSNKKEQVKPIFKDFHLLKGKNIHLSQFAFPSKPL